MVYDKAIAEQNWSGGTCLKNIHLDANRCNSIFGKSSAVQPNAVQILMIIKI